MSGQFATLGKLAAALAAAQAELRPAIKDSQNQHLKNRYADLGSCWDACREVLPRHGLAVIQVGQMEPDQPPALVTILAHESGEWVRGVMPLLSGDNKGINPMQALGSAMSYARRYGLAAIVGLTAEDDDGQAAGPYQKHAIPGGGTPRTDKDFREWATGRAARANERYIRKCELELGRGEYGEFISYYQLVNHLLKWATETGRAEARADGFNANHRDRALSAIFAQENAAILDEADRYCAAKGEEALAKLRGKDKGREPGEDDA